MALLYYNYNMVLPRNQVVWRGSTSVMNDAEDRSATSCSTSSADSGCQLRVPGFGSDFGYGFGVEDFGFEFELGVSRLGFADSSCSFDSLLLSCRH